MNKCQAKEAVITETMIERGLKAYKDWAVLNGTRQLVIDIIEAAMAAIEFEKEVTGYDKKKKKS